MSLREQIEGFSARSLRAVTTVITTPGGRQVIEEKDADGITRSRDAGRAEFAFCPDLQPDFQIGEPHPHVFIGSQDVAHNLELLQSVGITHILNVATGISNAFPENFIYQNIEILDLPDEDIWPHLLESFSFIQEGLNEGKVLVHCNAGVSRSGALLCAYIMKERQLAFMDALAVVRTARPCVQPNEGFVRQLIQHETELITTKNE
ncbi:dual specificity protein phosphatase 19-like isoform X2 [Corticium candelabrum]|uniref:dual specificity protein phosphatase 19-like isoform X2 n=1 Tax=Corticium candelabrum TaxID=121492 RepID=UPI002E274C98|nr:dual specificity protein phosphatase 19-like isoform X2 [Corticium candelabrum]